MSKSDEDLHQQILDDVKTQIFEDVRKLVEKEYTEKLLKKEEEVKEKLGTIEDLVKKVAERELDVNHRIHSREYQLIVDWINKLEKKDENTVDNVLKDMQSRIDELIKVDKDFVSLKIHDENFKNPFYRNESRESLSNFPSPLDDTGRSIPDVCNHGFLTQGSLQPFKNPNDSAIATNQVNNQNPDFYNQTSSSDGSMILLNGAYETLQLSRSISPHPPSSSIKRQKMIYIVKFGEFGVNAEQFMEPSGIAANHSRNEIIIVDTNCHRVQVFDKDGQFKLQYGIRGKNDGQLFYPNRVAINQITGYCIITERCPNHQIQIFDACGRFIRKFGASVLQYPRGICVDHKGRIIIVESKVRRVIIFDSYGNVLNKFCCGQHMDFPNSICASPDEEIFISDNRAHCIKVFNYNGVYLRQIGGMGITNYPIGVGVDPTGSIIVADNHNSFNLTIFDKHGKVLNALESKVKHTQVFDMAVLDDGTVAITSKDFRVYRYRYAVFNNELNHDYPFSKSLDY